MLDRDEIELAWFEEMPEKSALIISDVGARVVLDGEHYADWNPDTGHFELVEEED